MEIPVETQSSIDDPFFDEFSRYSERDSDFAILGSAQKQTWRDELQKEIDQLKIGKILFNPPDIMKVGVKERIEVRITQDIEADLEKALKGCGSPQTEEIKVYELMKVSLIGEDFCIASLNSLDDGEQVVSKIEFTQWAWDVTPRKRGKHILHLLVTLQIKVGESKEQMSHPVLDKEITVKVNPVYSTKIFLIENWKWVVTALLMPIVLVFLAHYLELLTILTS